MNNFKNDLKFSEEASHEAFWDAVYRKAFPNLVNHMVCSGDVASQRMGIDRSIMLSSGKTIYVDEKKRRKDWGDILLEYISVDTAGAPGWIEKDLHIDYLAYAFIPSKRCYLYPWEMLRRAWINFNEEWKEEYRIVIAQNEGYKTHSVAVPISVLNKAVRTASIIDVTKELT